MLPTHPFTNAEKRACLPMVDTLITAADVARSQGVLGLEDFVQKQGNDFLTFMMLLVVDGTDPELVQHIGQTLIGAHDHRGTELLMRMVILNGVLCIQAGQNPRLIECGLLSMLGEDILRERGLFPGGDPGHAAQAAAPPVSALHRAAPTQPSPLCHKVQPLSNRDIQIILREVEQTTLTIALLGCTIETAEIFLRNISKRLAQQILDNAQHMGPVRPEDITTAQQSILDTIQRLQSAGEISEVKE